MAAVIAAQCRLAGLILQQVKGREVGQIESFVEDQSGFDTAVGQKEPALQLRQAVSVLGHEEVSFVRLQPPREQRGLPWPETLRLHYFCVMSRPRNISETGRASCRERVCQYV